MIDDKDAGSILSEMVQISRTFKSSGQRSRDRGLTGTSFGFLQYLRRCDARLGDLAHGLGVSAPVASRAIDVLEANGMVTRRTDPQDARAFLISITDRGRAKLTESEGEVVRRFAQALAGWNPQDAGQAINILKTLNEHLGEALQGPGSPKPASSGTIPPTENGIETNK